MENTEKISEFGRGYWEGWREGRAEGLREARWRMKAGRQVEGFVRELLAWKRLPKRWRAKAVKSLIWSDGER